MRSWTDSNADAASYLRLGAQKPYYWGQYNADSVWQVDPVPQLATTRLLAYGVLVHVKLSAITEGLTTAGGKDISACLRFGSHLTQAATLIEQVVGTTVVDVTLQALLGVLARTQVSAPLMEVLQIEVREHVPPFKEQAFSIEGEKLKHIEAVDRLFQNTMPESKLKADEQVAFAVTHNIPSDEMEALDLRRGKTISDIDAAFSYASRFLSLSPYEIQMEGLSFWDEFHRLTHGNPLARAWMFNVPGIARIRAHSIAKREAAITILALLRYRYDNDGLPDELDELVSRGYISRLPIDLYSDHPLAYRRTEDSFILYSVGADFQDNNGRHSDKWGMEARGGDLVFWPVPNK